MEIAENIYYYKKILLQINTFAFCLICQSFEDLVSIGSSCKLIAQQYRQNPFRPVQLGARTQNTVTTPLDCHPVGLHPSSPAPASPTSLPLFKFSINPCKKSPPYSFL